MFMEQSATSSAQFWTNTFCSLVTENVIVWLKVTEPSDWFKILVNFINVLIYLLPGWLLVLSAVQQFPSTRKWVIKAECAIAPKQILDAGAHDSSSVS